MELDLCIKSDLRQKMPQKRISSVSKIRNKRNPLIFHYKALSDTLKIYVIIYFSEATLYLHELHPISAATPQLCHLDDSI